MRGRAGKAAVLPSSFKKLRMRLRQAQTEPSDSNGSNLMVSLSNHGLSGLTTIMSR
jgi:hypothetical protein